MVGLDLGLYLRLKPGLDMSLILYEHLYKYVHFHSLYKERLFAPGYD